MNRRDVLEAAGGLSNMDRRDALKAAGGLFATVAGGAGIINATRADIHLVPGHVRARGEPYRTAVTITEQETTHADGNFTVDVTRSEFDESPRKAAADIAAVAVPDEIRSRSNFQPGPFQGIRCIGTETRETPFGVYVSVFDILERMDHYSCVPTDLETLVENAPQTTVITASIGDQTRKIRIPVAVRRKVYHRRLDKNVTRKSLNMTG